MTFFSKKAFTPLWCFSALCRDAFFSRSCCEAGSSNGSGSRQCDAGDKKDLETLPESC